MSIAHSQISLVGWLGIQLGGTAWLIRLAVSWREVNEFTMAWIAIGLFVLANLIGVALYRLHDRLRGPKALVLLLSTLAALVTGLLIIASYQKTLALLSADANWLWIAPVLYLAFAIAVWVRFDSTNHRSMDRGDSKKVEL